MTNSTPATSSSSTSSASPTSSTSLELISFKLCPFVQRSVITLKHKQAPYKITFIDLENPPEWFEKLSPLGAVPVLKVTDAHGKVTPLFESAVINEYIDETVGEPVHPRDPLRRAFERAWIEYGSQLVGQLYGLTTETDPVELNALKDELFTDLQRLEDVVAKDGPYFRGREFGLVDSTYAPLFMRMFLAESLSPESPKGDDRWKQMPRVTKWAKTLLALPEVKESVVPEFAQLYREFMAEGALK